MENVNKRMGEVSFVYPFHYDFKHYMNKMNFTFSCLQVNSSLGNPAHGLTAAGTSVRASSAKRFRVARRLS